MDALQGGDRLSAERLVLVSALALSAGLGWAWWDSFHELFRFFGSLPGNVDRPFLFGGIGNIHCFAEWASVVLGGVLVLTALWSERLSGGQARRAMLARFSRKTFALAMPAMQVVLTLVNGLVLSGLVFKGSVMAFWVRIAVYSVATVLFMLCLIRQGLVMRALGMRTCAVVFVGALVVYALLNNLLFPLLAPIISSFAACVAYSIVAVAFCLLLWWTHPLSVADEEPPTESGSIRVPWRLAFHLCAYGFVFGLLHVLEGLMQRGSYSVNIGVFFGAMLAGIIFAVLFFRTGDGHGLWSKMQSTVFPLVIIGFVLVPQLSGSDVITACTEAGSFLYLGFLVLGCQLFMRRTDVGDRAIIALVMVLYGLGEALGVMAGAYLGLSFTASGAECAFITTVVIVLLTAATFWIGPADQVRKLWGLRRNLTPKRYNDLLVQARVRQLTESFGLTSREGEVLTFVAQGKRAPEIRDAMGVSIYTVRTHLRNLYAKIGVHSYAEAVQLLESVSVDEANWH